MHVITQLLRRDVVDQILLFPAGQPRLREHDPVATGAQRRIPMIRSTSLLEAMPIPS